MVAIAMLDSPRTTEPPVNATIETKKMAADAPALAIKKFS